MTRKKYVKIATDLMMFTFTANGYIADNNMLVACGLIYAVCRGIEVYYGNE